MKFSGPACKIVASRVKGLPRVSALHAALSRDECHNRIIGRGELVFEVQENFYGTSWGVTEKWESDETGKIRDDSAIEGLEVDESLDAFWQESSASLEARVEAYDRVT